MPNYDIRPAGQSSPVIRLYDESLDRVDRNQRHDAQRHSVVEGAEPKSDTSGLEPGRVAFEGYWLGSNASNLANTFRDDFANDPTVTRVEVQAGSGGSAVSSMYNGTYRLAEDAQVSQPSSGNDQLWNYRIVLIED